MTEETTPIEVEVQEQNQLAIEEEAEHMQDQELAQEIEHLI